jgi:hypothetical protein
MSRRQREDSRAFTPVARRRRYSARHLCRVKQDAKFLLSCSDSCQPGLPGSSRFVSGSPVNRADSRNTKSVEWLSGRLTRHECRAEYRLKPETGVNARAARRSQFATTFRGETPMRSQIVTASHERPSRWSQIVTTADAAERIRSQTATGFGKRGVDILRAVNKVMAGAAA